MLNLASGVEIVTVQIGLFVGDVADDSTGCMAWYPGFVAAGDERIAQTVEIHNAAFVGDDPEFVEQLSECAMKRIARAAELETAEHIFILPGEGAQCGEELRMDRNPNRSPESGGFPRHGGENVAING